MSCSRREMELFLHAHGQLSGWQRLRTASHVQVCDRCRSRWARWAVERETLRRSLGPAAGLDDGSLWLMDAVGARIRVQPREGPASDARVACAQVSGRRMLVLAAVVLLLAMGISAFAAFWSPPVRCGPGVRTPDGQLLPAGPGVAPMPAYDPSGKPIPKGALPGCQPPPREAAHVRPK